MIKIRDINYFELVKDKVNMEDVITQYAGVPTNRMRRIKCPLHRGRNLNFSYNNDFFTCFKCGASGDIYEFVAEYLGVSRWNALKQIDKDFRLGVFEKVSLIDYYKIEEKIAKRKRELALIEAERQRFVRLVLMRNAADIIMSQCQPTEDDPFPDLYCKAYDFRTSIQSQIETYIEDNLQC